jgi:hypothetical protein
MSMICNANAWVTPGCYRRRFPCWGRRIPPSIVIQGWKPSPLWTCDGGVIGVTPFLKASHLAYVAASMSPWVDVPLLGSAFAGARGVGSWSEVGAALRGAFELGNDTRLRPLASGLLVGGLPLEDGAAGNLASMLGNDDLRQCVVLCSTVSRGLVSLLEFCIPLG